MASAHRSNDVKPFFCGRSATVALWSKCLSFVRINLCVYSIVDVVSGGRLTIFTFITIITIIFHEFHIHVELLFGCLIVRLYAHYLLRFLSRKFIKIRQANCVMHPLHLRSECDEMSKTKRPRLSANGSAKKYQSYIEALDLIISWKSARSAFFEEKKLSFSIFA